MLIEDDRDIAGRLLNEFQQNSIKVLYCPDNSSAEEAIHSETTFDAVILDWFFQDSSSILSKLILKKLNNKHFRPVFIYTDNKADFDQTPKNEIEFPENLITCYSKETGLNELQEGINALLTNNISLQVANAYRVALRQTFERVLFEINQVHNIDLEKIFYTIYGDGTNVDWSNDIVLNLLHRAFISDDDFISRLTGILKKIKFNKSALGSEERKKILNKILYYISISDQIRNGDIISVTKSDKSLLTYGIVVTPDCDLAQKKTRYIEVVELLPIDDSRLGLTSDQIKDIKLFKHDSMYYLPSVSDNGRLCDLVALLKSKFRITESSDIDKPKYPTAYQRLLYSQNFICDTVNVKLNLHCSISNPFKSEFFHKLHTNNNRVGIPDIKDLC